MSESPVDKRASASPQEPVAWQNKFNPYNVIPAKRIFINGIEGTGLSLEGLLAAGNKEIAEEYTIPLYAIAPWRAKLAEQCGKTLAAEKKAEDEKFISSDLHRMCCVRDQRIELLGQQRDELRGLLEEVLHGRGTKEDRLHLSDRIRAALSLCAT